MNRTLLALSLATATGLFVTACGDDAKANSAKDTAPAATASAKVDLKNASFEERASYAVGASVGTYIATLQKEQSEFIGHLNQDLVVQGFIESLNGKTSLNEEEITKTLVDLDTKVREGLEAKQKADAAANLEAGKKFLAENGKKPEIKTTESGLQYQIIEEGKGKTPTADDEVRVKYKGTTIDGTVFDEQSEPITFPLKNIIPGWTEGLQLMKEGGKAKLFIPSDLAYGEMGAGGVIKPNSVLIFDIELVEVLKHEAAAEGDKK